MAHQQGRMHWENDRAMTKTSTLAAALWDFDGTLVDSEPLWLDAEFDLIADLGGTWSIDHADQLIGNSLLDSGSYILNTIGRHDLSPAWVVDELIIRVIQALDRPADPMAARGSRTPGLLCGGSRPLRPGFGVLSSHVGRGAEPAACRHLRCFGGGRRGAERQAAP